MLQFDLNCWAQHRGYCVGLVVSVAGRKSDKENYSP